LRRHMAGQSCSEYRRSDSSAPRPEPERRAWHFASGAAQGLVDGAELPDCAFAWSFSIALMKYLGVTLELRRAEAKVGGVYVAG